MKQLTSEMTELKNIVHSVPQIPEHHAIEPVVSTILHDIEDAGDHALPECTENFLPEEKFNDLMTFCESQTFTVEGNRKVSFYGEKYQYMGSKKTPKPMPPILSEIAQSLGENLNYELNQVLINKYEGSNSSLPEHKDDEFDINPQSSIFTVSLGSQTTVTFKHAKSGIRSELIARSNSLYEMSCDFQNHYTHQILPNPDNALRYSITFRCIHWKNLNSTYFTGDSNFGKLKLGEGRGTIGAATPGFKDFVATVDKLKPAKCSSFRNTVVMCGTNDLKLPNADVLNIYKVYKGKIQQMRECNPKGNIFICPVLPSRDSNINSKIFEFNKFLFRDLTKSDLNINVVQGFGQFLERDGLLKASMHDKRTDADVLHINENGYRILVRQIKNAIFSLKPKTSKITPGRPYASVARP